MFKINSVDLTLDFLKAVEGNEVVINHNDEDFYFKFDIKRFSEKLVIHTNGAINYDKKSPPVYQRYSWGKRINAHCIFIDDRTLHDVTDITFNTAWLIGTRDRYYVQDYSEIVQIIQNLLNIKNKNIFYWGSSAGGTASIALSTFHKGTTAIANNPQTNILTDSPRRRNAIFNNVFPDMEKDEVIDKYYYRLTLVALMKHKKYVPRIFFIQNIVHEPDVRKNLNPFKDELESSDLNLEKITYWFYHDNELGHAPLGLEKSLEYLHTIMYLEKF